MILKFLILIKGEKLWHTKFNPNEYVTTNKIKNMT